MPGEIPSRPIPIYTSKGDWSAILLFPHLYSPMGEWIGWITPDRQVYDVDGIYVGFLTDEQRILRRRTLNGPLPRRISPRPQNKIRPPATIPLPPMMSELPYDLLDVFVEEPERLHTVDTGEFKEDMD